MHDPLWTSKAFLASVKLPRRCGASVVQRIRVQCREYASGRLHSGATHQAYTLSLPNFPPATAATISSSHYHGVDGGDDLTCQLERCPTRQRRAPRVPTRHPFRSTSQTALNASCTAYSFFYTQGARAFMCGIVWVIC